MVVIPKTAEELVELLATTVTGPLGLHFNTEEGLKHIQSYLKRHFERLESSGSIPRYYNLAYILGVLGEEELLADTVGIFIHGSATSRVAIENKYFEYFILYCEELM